MERHISLLDSALFYRWESRDLLPEEWLTQRNTHLSGQCFFWNVTTMRDLSCCSYPICAYSLTCTNNTDHDHISMYQTYEDSKVIHDNPASLPPSHLSRDPVHSFIGSFFCCFSYWCFHSTIKWSSNIWWTSICKGKVGKRKSKGSVEGDAFICGKQNIHRTIKVWCKMQELEQDSPFQ